MTSKVSRTSCFSAGRQVGDVGDEVGELRGRLNLIDRAGDLGRHVGQERNRLARPLLQLMHARRDLGGIDLGLADLFDAGDQERIAGDETRARGSAACRATTR